MGDIAEVGVGNGHGERELRVAWAAGFIDADGSISVSLVSGDRAHNNSYGLTGHNRSRGTLEELQSLWGGTITHTLGKNMTGGTLRTGGDVGPRADIYTWKCGKENLRRALGELMPHLRLKREQARLLLEYMSGVGKAYGGRLPGYIVVERKRYGQKFSYLNRLQYLDGEEPEEFEPEGVQGVLV